MDILVNSFVDSFIAKTGLELFSLGLDPSTPDEEELELIKRVARFMVCVEEITEFTEFVNMIMKFIISWELEKVQ